MRIGFDGRVLDRPQATGVERYAHFLSKEFENHADLRILRSPLSKGHLEHIWTQTGLLMQAKNNAIDVLFCPTPSGPVLLPRRTKLVICIHDINFLIYPDLYPGVFRHYYRAILPLVLRRADLVLCNSNYTEQTLTERYPFVQNKSQTIYHGSSDYYQPLEGIERQKMILAVGSLNPNKNLARLIEAFSMIADKVEHDLVLVGTERRVISDTGHVRQALYNAPDGRVKFTGYLSDELLRNLYNEAELFVFPSLCEGFGVPPLEAMRCGCPALVSEATSIPEICSDAAVYCNPHLTQSIANKLEQMIRDDSLRSDIAKKGLQRARQFTFERSANETLQAIRVLNEKPH